MGLFRFQRPYNLIWGSKWNPYEMVGGGGGDISCELLIHSSWDHIFSPKGPKGYLYHLSYIVRVSRSKLYLSNFLKQSFLEDKRYKISAFSCFWALHWRQWYKVTQILPSLMKLTWSKDRDQTLFVKIYIEIYGEYILAMTRDEY